MAKMLTVVGIARLRPDKNRRLEIRDGGAPGLHLIVQPSGHKSWALRTRRKDGRTTKITLGVVDHTSHDDDGEPILGTPLSLTQARILCNQLQRQRARGDDIAEQKAEIARQRYDNDADKFKFARVAVDFVDDHARPNNRTWRTTARTLGLDYADGDEPLLIKNGLAERWSAKSIKEIDADALYSVIDEARRRSIPGLKPRNSGLSDARGRALGKALGRLFRWALQHRRVKTNVALGMFRPAPAQSRDRVLTKAELKSLWAAATEIGHPFEAIVKLLVLTGCRRDEIVRMRWSELSEDFSELNLPASRTKNKTAHAIPLPKLAQDIIRSIPRMANSDLCFTTTGYSPVSGHSKAKKKLDRLMGTSQPWRVHDIRRSVVTHMNELGVAPPHIIEACVGHIGGHKGGIAGVYNRAEYAQEKKAAFASWANHVKTIVA